MIEWADMWCVSEEGGWVAIRRVCKGWDGSPCVMFVRRESLLPYVVFVGMDGGLHCVTFDGREGGLPCSYL